jgi:hypothetical protein
MAGVEPPTVYCCVTMGAKFVHPQGPRHVVIDYRLSHVLVYVDSFGSHMGWIPWTWSFGCLLGVLGLEFTCNCTDLSILILVG